MDQALQRLLLKSFDAEFYKVENYDLVLSDSELFQHFLLVGGYEGRSPNPFFDASEYLSNNRDVLLAGFNPLVHYILHGKQEGRPTSHTIHIRQRLAILTECPDTDWISLASASLDADFYKQQVLRLFPFLEDREMNYAVHYSLLGWKLGLNPNAEFNTSHWIDRHPDLGVLKLAPILIKDIAGTSIHGATPEHQIDPPGNNLRVSDVRPDASKALDAVNSTTSEEIEPGTFSEQDPLTSSGLFDPTYYLATYADVRDAGVDPLYHYVNAGWREGRNPSSNFSTSFYLGSYKNVIEDGMNPLYHYFVKGQSMGYMTKPAGGWKMEVFQQAVSPEVKEEGYKRYLGKRLSSDHLQKLILSGVRKKNTPPCKIILAISHDSYSTVTGGTQIFIADEMANACIEGYLHLHLAPATPGLTIGKQHKGMESLLTVNGVIAGIADAQDVFRLLSGQKDLDMKLSIHSLIGFGSRFMQSLAPLAKKYKTIMWLHDYSLLCDGYNLLRNDTTFCGAPAPESIACEVCVYGRERSKRVRLIASWLAKVKPVLASPSQAALNVLDSSQVSLPFRQSLVVPHWMLTPGPSRKRALGSPLRLAFVGYAAPSKGWPIFDEVVKALAGTGVLKFYHFIKGGISPNPLVTAIDCAVSREARYITSALLKKHRIDVVMILSPWPETFSYVTAEALIAGCAIVCTASSGNVPALVKHCGQGLVFDSDDALMLSVRDNAFVKALLPKVAKCRFHKMRQNNGLFDVLPMIS